MTRSLDLSEEQMQNLMDITKKIEEEILEGLDMSDEDNQYMAEKAEVLRYELFKGCDDLTFLDFFRLVRWADKKGLGNMECVL